MGKKYCFYLAKGEKGRSLIFVFSDNDQGREPPETPKVFTWHLFPVSIHSLPDRIAFGEPFSPFKLFDHS
jgi:hypothetical protein